MPVGAGVGEPIEDSRRCMETTGLLPKELGLQVASMKAVHGHHVQNCDQGGGNGE